MPLSGSSSVENVMKSTSRMLSFYLRKTGVVVKIGCSGDQWVTLPKCQCRLEMISQCVILTEMLVVNW